MIMRIFGIILGILIVLLLAFVTIIVPWVACAQLGMLLFPEPSNPLPLLTAALGLVGGCQLFAIVMKRLANTDDTSS